MSFAVGGSTMLPVAVAACSDWVVTVTTGSGGTTALDQWIITASFVQCTEAVVSIRVLSNLSPGVPPSAVAEDVAIADDATLAVALGWGGVRLFRLCPPLEPMTEISVEPLGKLASRGEAKVARWIAPRISDAQALVVWSSAASQDQLAVHGKLPERLEGTALLTAPSGGIHSMDACQPGNVVVVCSADWTMHVLQRAAEGERFVARKLDLRSLGDPQRPRVDALCCVAIGDGLLAAGFKTRAVGNGMVEIFDVDTGAMVTRRLLQGREPTALATNGRRVLVGASVPADAKGAKDAKDAKSSLFALVADEPYNVTVCADDGTHPYWPPHTVKLGQTSWCYARAVMHPTLGHRVAVVEHAWVPRIERDHL